MSHPRYDYAFQTLSENGYKWREYDAEDTIRFYALHLRDVGPIKSTPQKIIESEESEGSIGTVAEQREAGDE